MSFDTLVVVRGEFLIEDPWAIPETADPIRLLRSADGEAPRLATTVAAYYDQHHLTIVFSAIDDYIQATMTKHDDPLYTEDVVEVFLAPERIEEYYEIEVNPLGATFDARINSPELERKTMRANAGWDCQGLVAAVRKNTAADGTMTLDTLVRIPFVSLGKTVPEHGDVWRGNFFRIDRHPQAGDEYTSWRPTLKTPPDFHVPRAFGSISFHH